MSESHFHWKEPTAGETLAPSGLVLNEPVATPTVGPVWSARRVEDGEAVWVYWPPDSVVRDAVLFDEYQRRTAKLLPELHPIFQRVLEVVTEGCDWPYTVLEAVPGVDLNRLRLSTPDRCIPASQLKGWLQPVFEGLEVAHANKIPHRALSPDALVIDREGQIRVRFHAWLALYCDLEQRGQRARETQLPIAYLSPQVLDGRAGRVGDDLYSLAATVYELLTSQPPFAVGDLAHQIRHVDPPSMRERLEDLDRESDGEGATVIPESLDQAVLRCLAKKPDTRFESVAEFWKAAWPGKGLSTEATSGVKARAAAAKPSKETESPPAPVARPAVVAVPEPDLESAAGESNEAIGSEAAQRREELYEPYLPPAPMPSYKRFGVVFAGLVLLVAVVVGVIFDRYRERFNFGDSTAVGKELLSRDRPMSSTNATTYEEFAALVPPAELPNDVGWLAVRSEPTEALVELWHNASEIPVEQVTPTVFSNLPPGEVELRFEATGFLTTNFVTTVSVGVTNRVSAVLPIAMGTVSLRGEPAGVRYVLKRGEEEIRSGRCPDEFAVRVGLYQLDYQLGNRTRTQYLRVSAEEPVADEYLFESGKLSIETEPEEVAVFLGLESVGMTPLTLTNLPPGNHRLRLQAPRHRSVVVSAEIKKNIETFVSRKLVALTAAEGSESWENLFGMRFEPVGSPRVLFGVHEVTIGQYQAFFTAAGAAAGLSQVWREAAGDDGTAEAYPVTQVSASEAMAFCRWLTEQEHERGALPENQRYRLPTESEWSRAVAIEAAAIGAGQSYPWGYWPPGAPVGNYGVFLDEEDNVLAFMQDGYQGLAPVGQFSGNRYGLYDLGGNVWEWCVSSDGDRNSRSVIRGGGWRDTQVSKISSRYTEELDREARREDVGFRVVLDLGNEG